MEVVFGDFRLGLRNINDLMSPILTGRLVGVQTERFSAMIARFGKHMDELIYLFGRYQISVGTLVTRLAAWLALLGLLRRPSLGFGCWCV
jgi:hypothetical protein